jgi:hypothetical protein
VVAGLLLGFFISVAEPDLHVLAGQVDMVTGGLVSKLSIVLIVSVGIAVLLSFGLVRIIYGIPLNKVLTVIYGLICVLALFTAPEFMAISFDASSATTGALTVPFILALSLGVSALKKDSKASEKDSFGLVAVVSTGAILSVMLMSIISKADKATGALEVQLSGNSSILEPFLRKLPVVAFEIALALLPILLIYLIFHKKAAFGTGHHRMRPVIGLLYHLSA